MSVCLLSTLSKIYISFLKVSLVSQRLLTFPYNNNAVLSIPVILYLVFPLRFQVKDDK